MTIFSISGLLTGITSLLLGIFVFLKRKNNVHKIWSVFCFSVAVWGFGGYKLGMIQDLYQGFIWWKITYIGIIFIPVFFYHFVYLFLKLQKSKFLYFSYFFGFFFLFLEWSPWDYLFFGIDNISFLFNSLYWVFPPTPLFSLFVFLWFFIVFYSHLELFRAFKDLSGIKRTQVYYFFVGMAIAFIGGGACFLPCFGVDLYPFCNFTIIFYPIIITYAIIKHHLFDIRIIIQRGLIYSITFSLFISFYLILISVLGYFFQQGTDTTVLIGAGITTLVGIYSIQYIEKFFQRMTDKIFFKDKYDYQEAVYELSQILNKNIELEILLRYSIKKLNEILKAKKAEIFLLEKNIIIDDYGSFRRPTIKFYKKDFDNFYLCNRKIINTEEIPYILKDLKNKPNKTKSINLLKIAQKYGMLNNIHLFVVISLERQFIGAIMLGEKKSGDIFNSDDFNLLKTFSAQAAVALVKAQLYAKVKNYSRDLEKRVKQRTAKIQGLQEEQRQMMLEVSHSLQTPLTIIKGELEFLKKDMPNNNNLLRFEKSIDKISKFIYDMLRLAKLESMDKNPQMELINFSELINDLIEYFDVVAQEKDIKIIKEIEDSLYIFGDKDKLEEMVTNIVGNATKYVDKNKSEHKVIIKLKKEGKKIKLNITDNGIGINKYDLTNLFTKFYRSQEVEHSRIKGTGLGLVVAKRIAEMHGGNIFVESEVDIGTKFIIELPYKSRRKTFKI